MDEDRERERDIQNQPLDERQEPSTGWEISKLLMDAHSHSGKAMERYLLLQHLEQNSADDEIFRTAVEQALEDHRRIIEELETLLEQIDAESDP